MMLRPIRRSAARVYAVLAMLWCSPALAQDAPSPAHDPLPAPQGPSPDAQPVDPVVPAPPPRSPSGPGANTLRVTGTPGQGVTLDTVDDRLSLNIRGRIWLREAVVQPPTGAASNETSVRQARIVLGGHLFSRDVNYFLQLGLANSEYDTTSSVSPIYDAWVSYTALRDLNVRAGQFLVPFDRQRIALDAALQFADRSTVMSEFTLDRDVGVELSSKDLFGLHGRLQYALGVFSGQGRDRAAASPPGFLYVARLQVSPFGAFDDNVEADLERLDHPRLAIGVAGAFNHNVTRQRGTLGPTLNYGTFDYLHATADLHFKLSGFSLLAEALYRQADHDSNTGTAMMHAVSEYSRSGYGYFAQAGYAITSHFEAAARWGQYFAGTGTDPTLVTAVNTLGHEVGGVLSWYIQGHPFKVQTDYFYFFGDSFSAGRHQWRLQLQASF